MGILKTHTVQKADILKLESELNNLWGELKTSNIPHPLRMELEEKLSSCEEQLKAALSGQASFQELETNLRKCDHSMAMAAIQQAENELPKSEHGSANFLALENLRKELDIGEVSPIRARHEVKRIMRPHT